MTDRLSRYVRQQLRAAADPAKAEPMAAYMKTEMPFYGVQKPGREQILRVVVKRFPPDDRRHYEASVRALWEQPHREERYLAIAYARAFDRFVTLSAIPLFRMLIRTGAWWDFVDEVAVQLVGRVQRRQRVAMRPRMDAWIDDDDMWIRRAAMISQIGHGTETDADQLFDYALRRAEERPFFIRKAIGWALREYARTEPDAVRRFLVRHRDRFAPLTVREAGKHLF